MKMTKTNIKKKVKELKELSTSTALGRGLYNTASEEDLTQSEQEFLTIMTTTEIIK
jgi:hypothetical protein